MLTLLAGPAAATVAEVAEKLRENPVYRDPNAEMRVSTDQLLGKVKEAGTPIYIAILPTDARAETENDYRKLTVEVARAVGQPGTYMVISGRQYGTGNVGDTLPDGRATALAKQAIADNPSNPEAALLQFVDGVSAAARGEPAAQTSGDGGGPVGGSPPWRCSPVLLVGGGALIFGARRRTQGTGGRAAAGAGGGQVGRQRGPGRAQSDDIRALDLDTSMPDADQEAVRHYTEAVDQYQKAATALDRAKRTEDLAPMSAALEAGRFSMASTKAILEGRPLPERRPPCFFDPRHGPSVEDVEWAPPDGAPRMVPACAADAQRIHDGLEPESRQVLAGAGGRMTPYWNAPGYYGPWAGGYFGGFPMGGLFTGLALGSFLGGGWGGYPV